MRNFKGWLRRRALLRLRFVARYQYLTLEFLIPAACLNSSTQNSHLQNQTNPTPMAISNQVPVASQFDRSSTGQEVLAAHALAGKTAIVTGGYSGIGWFRPRPGGQRLKSSYPHGRLPAPAALAGTEGDVHSALDLADLHRSKPSPSMLSEFDSLDLLQCRNHGQSRNPGRTG